MGFVWHDFGVLNSVDKDANYVYISNNKVTLKMSIGKYMQSALDVYSNALGLINKDVIVRTSQNTANWSTDEWFSDIKEK